MKKLTAYRRLLRGEQWYKNLLIFMPLSFAPTALLYSISELVWGFFGFCFISSVTYIINDWLDQEKDRIHPTKKFRPLAVGTINGKEATMVICILLTIVIFIASQLGIFYGGVLGTYFVLTNLYSYGLKNIPIIDISMIASNFLLRALAGVRSVPDQSSWPYFLMIFSIIIIFLSHKRRSDIKFLGEKAIQHKPVLQFYSADKCYALRIIGYLVLSGMCFLLYQQGAPLGTMLAILMLMLTTSFVFSKDPVLVIKPHYLFKLWYYDIILLLAVVAALATS